MQARMGRGGCRTVGWIRIAYAAIFLADRLLLGLDVTLFFSSSKSSLAPIDQVNRKYSGYNVPYQFTLLDLFPRSDVWLWIMYVMGLVHGSLLLLGIHPRINAILMQINFRSFKNTTPVFWDGEDELMLILGFYMFFLPLHHVTIYDRFGTIQEKLVPGKAKNDTRSDITGDSWPMWPVWLVKWQMVLIYMGAAAGKLNGKDWTGGTAMYYISHMISGEFGGIFTPDFLFNHMLPMKVMTWGALAVELFAPIAMWFDSLRWPSFAGLLALHLGIELTMNMHVFEFLTMLGWCFYFVVGDAKVSNDYVQSQRGRSDWKHQVLGTLLFVVLVSMATIFATPIGYIHTLGPEWLSDSFNPVIEWTFNMRRRMEPFAHVVGNYQYTWDMFDGGQTGGGSTFVVEATLRNSSTIEVPSPDFVSMTWWELKRHLRLVDFYCNLLLEHEMDEQVLFVKYIQQTTFKALAPELVKLELWAERFYIDPPPIEAGWWGPVRNQTLNSNGDKFIVRVMVCQDFNPKCQKLAQHGFCISKPKYMADTCPYSCNFCQKDKVQWAEDDPDSWYEIGHPSDKDEEDEPCLDLDGNCQDWSDEGLCSSEWRFMAHVCPLSCDLCGVSDDAEEEDESDADYDEESKTVDERDESPLDESQTDMEPHISESKTCKDDFQNPDKGNDAGSGECEIQKAESALERESVSVPMNHEEL